MSGRESWSAGVRLSSVSGRPTGRPTGRVAVGVALGAAVLVTVWWGLVGLGTENFGSDCVFSFGESGPRAEHCQQVNDRAEAWLPRLVAAAWACAVLCPLLPRRYPPGRRAAAGVAVACLAAGVVLGTRAWSLTSP